MANRKQSALIWATDPIVHRELRARAGIGGRGSRWTLIATALAREARLLRVGFRTWHHLHGRDARLHGHAGHGRYTTNRSARVDRRAALGLNRCTRTRGLLALEAVVEATARTTRQNGQHRNCKKPLHGSYLRTGSMARAVGLHNSTPRALMCKVRVSTFCNTWRKGVMHVEKVVHFT